MPLESRAELGAQSNTVVLFGWTHDKDNLQSAQLCLDQVMRAAADLCNTNVVVFQENMPTDSSDHNTAQILEDIRKFGLGGLAVINSENKRRGALDLDDPVLLEKIDNLRTIDAKQLWESRAVENPTTYYFSRELDKIIADSEGRVTCQLEQHSPHVLRNAVGQHKKSESFIKRMYSVFLSGDLDLAVELWRRGFQEELPSVKIRNRDITADISRLARHRKGKKSLVIAILGGAHLEIADDLRSRTDAQVHVVSRSNYLHDVVQSGSARPFEASSIDVARLILGTVVLRQVRAMAELTANSFEFALHFDDIYDMISNAMENLDYDQIKKITTDGKSAIFEIARQVMILHVEKNIETSGND